MPMILPRFTHMLVNSSFFLLKRSISYRSRPKARTTRTPVRFSCTRAVSSPSVSSARWNFRPTMT